MSTLLYQTVFDLKNDKQTALKISDFQIDNHFLLKDIQGTIIPIKTDKTIKYQYLSCSCVRFFCDYILNSKHGLELYPLSIHKSHPFHTIQDSNSHYRAQNIEVSYYHIYFFENSLELWDNFSPSSIQIKNNPDESFKNLNSLDIAFELIRRTITDSNLKVWDC